MADPSFVGASTVSTTLTPNLPAGLAENDLMFLHYGGRNSGAFDPTVTGWNLIGVGSGDIPSTTNDTPGGLWWRRATASESAPTVSTTGTVDNLAGVISAWRDARNPSDTAVEANDGTVTPIAVPEVNVAGRTLAIAFQSTRVTISSMSGDGFTQNYRQAPGDTTVLCASKLYEYAPWDTPELPTIGGVFFTVALAIRGGIYVDGAVHLA